MEEDTCFREDQKLKTVSRKQFKLKQYGETRFKALWRPEFEGSPERRGYMSMYDWFILLYSRNQYKIIKQLFVVI